VGFVFKWEENDRKKQIGKPHLCFHLTVSPRLSIYPGRYAAGKHKSRE
jgi:hypothetical protein